ncbi:efflux RND transporter periplasmic adaptor subunit [Urbifossiella limnaea]|uniref:Cobalt-zinc-cadmium resistance protein CzcB n=1 Tax=Urbifossiella limnaea TaxID=2528023 RepID=A0A517XLX3_9BACT|nr:efflux RND transporter periplasmic adaptor subunit [Urbifossiella limnaea]QDU18499.1 Cobalt-zinc-cadmium resistance protein CzcB [Urbifossiella limnaea]
MRLDRAVALVALLAAGCSRPPAGPGAAAPAAAPPVTVVKVEKRPVKRVVEQPGAVHPFEETVLHARVGGYVQKLDADIGTRVTRDQVLAELAVPELEEEFKQKEALVRQADAEVTQAKKALAASAAGVAAAKAHVVEAEAGLGRAQAVYVRWQSEAERIGRLVAGGVIDTQTRDETLNQLKSAEAGRAEATAKVTSAGAAVAKADADRDKAAADVAAADARLDVARAGVRRTDALRAYTRIKAPFDGVVTRRTANTGDFVAADGRHGLFAVARLDPVRVVVNVPEADAGLVDAGTAVSVALPTAGAPVSGKVVRTSWALDPGSRTLRTEIDLPNPGGKVRPGMYVVAKLTAELPAEWAVPAAAVGKANDEPVVFLAEGGKAVRVAVQFHRGDAQHTQVRRYRRPGTADWTDFTGAESVAAPAAAVTDGQALP